MTLINQFRCGHIFTISDLSKLYAISDKSIKDAVADQFGLTHASATSTMGKYLHGLTIIRNLCAHGSRIYNRLFITKPSLNKKELSLLRKDVKGNADNSRLFGYILNIKRLMKADDFGAFKAQLISLKDEFPFVSMKYYGFCDNWKNVL